MANELECSAYRLGGLCANGFPQNAACLGVTCSACGRPTAKVPMCLREELPEPWIDESGRPTFARETSHGR